MSAVHQQRIEYMLPQERGIALAGYRFDRSKQNVAAIAVSVVIAGGEFQRSMAKE